MIWGYPHFQETSIWIHMGEFAKMGRHSDVAFFSFVDLCDKLLGAADYLAVGHAFHTATRLRHHILEVRCASCEMPCL